ncbi:MAG: 2-amino-4-hydroxy-6-hydroxymethyldihydropteridine diphosphokinase [Saprospiraceae bacterium]
MHSALLHLGTNQGVKKDNITMAYELIIKEVGPIAKYSSFYHTKAWGYTDQNDFVNTAIEIETQLSPFSLLQRCQQIENDMGRVITYKWGPRIIDIDIIFYDRILLQSSILTIPHPQFRYRPFVLDPLNEIYGNYIDPLSGLRVDQC